jgi:prepilin-type N-terminal cleavage/methylation domain-containing protein/prepilin-type processing-associated H-X9-DG protein
MTRRSRRAFTLVELLVVIGIIALLVAILLPALNKARQQALLVNCAANLKSIGQAAYTYTVESKGFVPRDDFDGKENFWPTVYSRLMNNAFPLTDAQVRTKADVVEYLKTQAVFHCPALGDDGRALHYACNNIDWDKFANTGQWGYPPGGGRYDYVALTRVPRGAENVAYLAEVNSSRLAADDIGFFDLQSEPHLMFRLNGTANGGPRMIHANDKRHLGRTPILFFDGHVEVRRHEPGEIPATLFNPLATLTYIP